MYEQAARQLGVEVVDRGLMPLRVEPGERQAVAESLRQCGWDAGCCLLGVNVNASELCQERRWPLPRYAALITELLERRCDLRVVLVGSPRERPYTESLLELLPGALRQRVFVAAGRWTLGQFLAALPMFKVFLTNDSGPMHLAAAQGVPIVSLWGPERPEFYGPQVEHHRPIEAEYPCRPCLKMFTTFEGMWCDHQGSCMEAIEPADVMRAVDELLDRPARGTALEKG